MIRTYRVKPRVTFGPAGMYKPGDLVELEESEAEGFKDKLELADKKQGAKTLLPVPSLKNDLNVEIPEELKLLSEEKEEGFRLSGEDIIPEKPAKPRTQRKSKAK